MKPVVVMAGGTGGHVFPALAVALQLRAAGNPVVWMGTKSGLEAEVIPKQDIPVAWISISGLRGKGLFSWFVAPFKLIYACSQAFFALLKIRPSIVIGMGGFVTGPGGIMARLLGIPLLIHEQNAVAGLTNRILAKFANRVMEAFPGTFKGRKVEYTGNPVRQEIAHITEPGQRFASRSGKIRLLVLGGSLGARALNRVLPEALAMLPEAQRPEVWHQAGKRNIEDAKEHYEKAKVEVRLLPFIDDMAEVLAWADLVVCRAGALTIAELAAAGIGAILVPFPYAVDDHQTFNAKYLADQHAAYIVQESQLNGELLSRMLAKLTQSRENLLELANVSRSLARADATDRVVNLCQEYIKRRS